MLVFLVGLSQEQVRLVSGKLWLWHWSFLLPMERDFGDLVTVLVQSYDIRKVSITQRGDKCILVQSGTLLASSYQVLETLAFSSEN